jgi:beta-galactosidase
MEQKRRAAARLRAGGRNRAQPKLAGRALRVGNAEVPLHSGAMHYWRLERDAWRPGLEEIKNLGLPIVDTYVPWGVHEIAR